MNFSEAERYLYSLGNEVSTMKLGLENIEKLLHALGDPQIKYLKVQVAGTNGKGSVCAFLDSICNTAGIRTGTFTSPHLISITERVRINGSDITEDDFARYATRVREIAEQLVSNKTLEYTPTFFEQVTALALVAFAEAKVEVAILETGLGGRLDATTAAKAEIAAITRIDLDHQEYLGDTIEEIAAEKAAIIRSDTMAVFVAEQSYGSMRTILDRCEKVGLEIKGGNTSGSECAGKKVELCKAPSPRVGFPPFSLGLAGEHQVENAGIAVAVADSLKTHFSINDEDIRSGLQNARHGGRLEPAGRYLFDGAHNVGGAKALAAYLDDFVDKSITLIFGAMQGKDVAGMLLILAPRVERIILTEPSNSRSQSYEQLLGQLPQKMSKEMTFVTGSVENAIEMAETVTLDSGIIIVSGSLYLVGEVKRHLADSASRTS